MTAITAKSGTFVGNDLAANVSEFLGIQFATANRFDPPSDATEYSTRVVAKGFGSQSPQGSSYMEQLLGTKDIPADENCLNLNIWSPKDAKGLPVLFWIHGGAYTNGTGATAWYHGTQLVRTGNVLVVTINYRLGPFGFLGDNNVGLLDQISALRWVQTNIEAFGGDPENVTIFGESAGGSSVVALTASDLTAGLFKRGWAMSPSLLQLRSRQQSQRCLDKFLASAKVDSVDELRRFSSQQLIDAATPLLIDLEDQATMFSPTCGGVGLPVDINLASAKSGVDLVVGTNRDENRLWTVLSPESSKVDQQAAINLYTKKFDTSAQSVWDTYMQFRPNHSSIEMVAALLTDENFRAPAWKLCETRSVHANPTWMYWFTWPSPVFDGAFGSCHGLDIPFAFNNLDQPNVEVLTGTDPNRSILADKFSSLILNFAKTGDPTWPQFDIEKRRTLQLDLDAKIIENPEPEIRQLWHSIR